MHNKRHVILVVDDEKKVTMSLKSFFETLGHEMYTALDGEEANKVIETIRPELIILDIRMPKVDGKEILKRVRSVYSKTKVIIITAYEEEKGEVEELGIDGFFIKPVDLPALIDRIKYVLETKKDTRVYPTKAVKKEVAIEKIPKAKILFIEPNINVYGFTSGLFDSKDFNPGDYEIKVVYSLKEAFDLFGPKSLYGFSPDIVIMYDFNTELTEIDKLADYIMSLSFKPKEVIMHGIFPRSDYEIMQLEKKGITYCNQNIMTDEELRNMNKKLIDFVGKECVRLGLVK